ALIGNFCAGLILGFLPLLAIGLLEQYPELFQLPVQLSFQSVLQAIFLRGTELLTLTLGRFFPPAFGAITALTGYLIGYGRGHMSYDEQQNRSSFRKLSLFI